MARPSTSLSVKRWSARLSTRILCSRTAAADRPRGRDACAGADSSARRFDETGFGILTRTIPFVNVKRENVWLVRTVVRQTADFSHQKHAVLTLLKMHNAPQIWKIPIAANPCRSPFTDRVFWMIHGNSPFGFTICGVEEKKTDSQKFCLFEVYKTVSVYKNLPIIAYDISTLCKFGVYMKYRFQKIHWPIDKGSIV